MSTISYRPDIDGLRAIAVLSIIFYHSNLDYFNSLSGGFLGVDIFFVISGFLITQTLLKELADQNFKLKFFYERRARRILPLLIIVKIATIPFAWFLLAPNEVHEYSASMLSSLAFGSNIWFSFDQGYWAANNSLKPFLHTWSLSVEEQYYLLFPLLLWLTWRHGRIVLVSFFIVLFLLSLASAHYWALKNPVFAFYWLPTRFWEMLAGSLVAIYVVFYPAHNQALGNSVIPSAGLLLILGSLFWFDSETFHPSFFTLIPILGTVMLLAFPSNGSIVFRVLSSRPAVLIGLLSYGAYLWHYPIFAFTEIAQDFTDADGRFLMIIITFILSLATYHLIERPSRNRDLVPIKQVLIVLTLGVSILLIFNTYALTNSGDIGRFSKEQLEILGTIKGDNEAYSKYVTEDYNNNILNNQFVENERLKVLIIGDSYSQDFYNILMESGLGDQVEIVARYIPAYCHNIPQRFASKVPISSKRINNCKNVVRVGHPEMRNLISTADMSFISSNWNAKTIPFVQELEKDLYANGARKVMFVGNKRFPNFTRSEILNNSKESLREIRKSIDPKYRESTVALGNAQLDNYLDLQALMCGNSEKCPIVTEAGFVISYDGYHLSRHGARKYGNLLLANKQFMDFWHLD